MNKLLCVALSSCGKGPLEPSALTSDNMLCIHKGLLNTKVASVGPAACLLSRSPTLFKLLNSISGRREWMFGAQKGHSVV